VQALTDGIIAILALSDIKAEVRRNPKEVNHVMQVISKKAM
jgi:hypothetical protein